VRSGLVLLIVGAAGCNQLFGLDPTQLADGDAGAPIDGLPVDAIPCDPIEIHDEDGDAVPDSCDNWPHLDAAQDDDDGDGVGDACDPQEGRNDDILFFAGFPDGTAEGWVLFRGNWTASGGDFIQLDAAATSGLAYHPFELPPEAVISTSYEVAGLGFPPVGVGVRAYAFDFAQSQPDGYECRVGIDTNQTAISLYAWAENVGDVLATAPLDAPFDIGSAFDIDFLHTGDGEMHCDVDAGAPSADVIATSTLYSAGVIALHTVRTGAAFRYVVAIGPAPAD
jgi:hypothetical protein